MIMLLCCNMTAFLALHDILQCCQEMLLSKASSSENHNQATMQITRLQQTFETQMMEAEINNFNWIFCSTLVLNHHTQTFTLTSLHIQ